MKARSFSIWTKWENRNSIKGIKFPGVYMIAISKLNISGQQFELIPEICYIGMTNSKAGLRGRLKQFDNTIKGNRGHGGADRFRNKYANYQDLVEMLYVSVAVFECDVNTNAPEDLKIMGEVAYFEYYFLANFVEKFRKLPEFNDKQNSPKYSLTHK